MNRFFFTSVCIIFLLISCSEDDKPLTADLNRDPQIFTVSVSSVTASSAVVEWEASTDPDNDPVSYAVILEGTEIQTYNSPGEHSITGLTPGTEYTGSVTANDDQGGNTSVEFFFTTLSPTTSTSGEILWQKSYGGNDDDDAYTVASLPDGGYIVGGSTESTDGDISSPIGGTDAWILKLNGEGELEWEITLGGSDYDKIHDIKPTMDGGFIVGAFSTSADNDVSSNSGMRDYWIVKLTSSGSIEWSVNLGENSDEILESIIETSNGDFVAVGHTLSEDISFGKADAWVVKINSSGELVWDTHFGSSQNDTAVSVFETNDSGYLLGGYITTADNKRDGWLIKIDENGELEWERFYGGDEDDEFVTAIQTQDNGFILGGFSRSEIPENIQNGAADAWIIKTDDDGNILWQKTFGGMDSEVISDTVEIPGEGFAFTGTTRMPDSFSGEANGGSDILVLKIDLNGNILWQRSLGGSGDDYGHSITINQDQELVVAGSHYTHIVEQGEGTTGDFNFWIAKLQN